MNEEPQTPSEDRTPREKERENGRRLRPVRYIALAGVYAALLTGGKEALAAIPNVEVVTLLCALGGYALGAVALASIAAFVTVEGAIYGFGSWIISYYVHWPLVCAAFMLIRIFVSPQRRVLLRVVPTAAALILTLGFSALTSVVDVGILGGATNAGFFERFTIYYARGIPFYVAQLVTNAVLFPLVFPIIAKALIKAKTRFICT